MTTENKVGAAYIDQLSRRLDQKATACPLYSTARKTLSEARDVVEHLAGVADYITRLAERGAEKDAEIARLVQRCGR